MVSIHQAQYDRQYLYDILVTATINMQHKIIFMYLHNSDGIMAWFEFKNEFAYDGFKELRLKDLESMTYTPFANTDKGRCQHI